MRESAVHNQNKNDSRDKRDKYLLMWGQKKSYRTEENFELGQYYLKITRYFLSIFDSSKK